MTFDEYLVSWAQIHGTKRPTGLVLVWLRMSFTLSTPLTRLNPNVITAFGPLLMLVAIYFAESTNRNYFLASIIVFAVGLVDSFDGIVAVRTSKTSSWGAFLDGIVDRLIDTGIGLLLIVLGAPIEIAVLAFTIALIHEYMRAKASGLGFREVGVITPAEKPTRIAIGTMFLFACGVLPEQTSQLAIVASQAWLALGAISFAMLMRAFRKNLKA
ncbi:MAG: CDP-alcohol phosphatidyltransferase family protein [Actinobacteria bacterium]|nr:CDP-alcohol phosphatidyltransferase family protein [Actinomycetota bacterium]NBO34372.1 CDP-alcohol phosphatidyltransferase family protein [Actinomycetota bacterium]